jgi:hypothetical protein
MDRLGRKRSRSSVTHIQRQPARLPTPSM